MHRTILPCQFTGKIRGLIGGNRSGNSENNIHGNGYSRIVAGAQDGKHQGGEAVFQTGDLYIDANVRLNRGG